MHTELLIGGVFYGGPCDSSIGKTQHYAPYDGALVGTAAEAGWSELSSALSAASEAYYTWQYSSTSERQTLLREIANNVRIDQEELAELLCNEVGKPITLALAEVERLAVTFELAANLLDSPNHRIVETHPDKRSKSYQVQAIRKPIGVVLAIVPYNWPYNLAAHKIAPALAAGNTLVVKAPGQGTLSTLRLGRLIHESGCPDGVINVINCPGILAEKAALDERVAMVSFTGSPKIGWMLKEKAWRKRVSLELGGDATAVVDTVEDIQIVAQKLAISSFAYAGQICISTQHVLVQERLFEKFRIALIHETENLATGDPSDPQTICGPIINSDALERIQSWIKEAEDQGCAVHGGSQIGQVLEPTIVENVTRNQTLGREEVFGPVVTLQPYESLSEAIDWINSSQFGIHASIFSTDKDQINQFCREVEVGGIIINDVPSIRFDAMPYGGVKNSGFGREGVFNTLLEMTEEQAVVTKR